MSTWIWVPDRGYGGGSNPSVTEAPFGDGYTGRVAEGLNPIKKDLKMTMTGRSAAEIRAAVAFLEARQGVEAFDYTDHITQVLGKYICQQWDWTYEHEGSASLTATFKRVYET